MAGRARLTRIIADKVMPKLMAACLVERVLSRMAGRLLEPVCRNSRINESAAMLKNH